MTPDQAAEQYAIKKGFGRIMYPHIVDAFLAGYKLAHETIPKGLEADNPVAISFFLWTKARNVGKDLGGNWIGENDYGTEKRFFACKTDEELFQNYLDKTT